MPDERQESRSEEHAQQSGGQGKKFFLAGLLGAAAGAITAMLLTPWRGSEARQRLKEGAHKAGEAAKESAAKASAAAKEGAVKAGKAIREKTSEVARRAKGEEEKKKDSKAR